MRRVDASGSIVGAALAAIECLQIIKIQRHFRFSLFYTAMRINILLELSKKIIYKKTKGYKTYQPPKTIA